jgi:uncharacterized protein (TIGR03067 family)
MSKRVLLVLAAVLLVAADDKKKDLEQMQGTWTVVESEADGKKAGEADLKAAKLELTIKDNKFTYKAGDTVLLEGTVELGPDKTPKALDAKGKDPTGREAASIGIYELKGDTMRVCFVPAGERPTKFDASAGSKQTIVVYQRKK